MIDYVNRPAPVKPVAASEPSDFTKVVIALPFAGVLLLLLPVLFYWGFHHAA